MAKLADALASGASDRKVMGVQVPPGALDFVIQVRHRHFQGKPCTMSHIHALFGKKGLGRSYVPIFGTLKM